MEHIPGYKNKAADCLRRLPFVTRKRNDNPLKDEESTTINVIQEDNDSCCPLCEVDLTDTQTLQKSDKCCIRIAKLLEDPKSKYHERLIGMMIKGFYTILTENGRE